MNIVNPLPLVTVMVHEHEQYLKTQNLDNVSHWVDNKDFYIDLYLVKLLKISMSIPLVIFLSRLLQSRSLAGRSFSARHALRAGAELPQVEPGINSQVMIVVPGKP
jgi:hypothetical protein